MGCEHPVRIKSEQVSRANFFNMVLRFKFADKASISRQLDRAHSESFEGAAPQYSKRPRREMIYGPVTVNRRVFDHESLLQPSFLGPKDS